MPKIAVIYILKMIVVTGAAGFIGSALVGRLNEENIGDIIVVDDFFNPAKSKNLADKKFVTRIHRDIFFRWLDDNAADVDFIFHLGARTDTTEFDMNLLNRLNLHYSMQIWEACAKHKIPLVYASSAATYGSGEFGYDDDNSIIEKLQPLNPYGISKNEFDKWVLKQTETPPFWAGLKFFNVYGPNEYHKGRMASVIWHAWKQINETGKMKLFRSHRPDFTDGGQMRDFVYVKDVTNVLYYLYIHNSPSLSGIYNLGSGKAETFLSLAKGVFSALGKPENIEFIDTPADIRDKYQYFTEAKMGKLRKAGYKQSFYLLEDGIQDYVKEYLEKGDYF